MTRTMLKDEQWHKLHTILCQINVYDKPNLRLTIEAMLYRIRVGYLWRDIPDYFDKWQKLYVDNNARLQWRMAIY